MLLQYLKMIYFYSQYITIRSKIFMSVAFLQIIETNIIQ